MQKYKYIENIKNSNFTFFIVTCAVVFQEVKSSLQCRIKMAQVQGELVL